MKYLYPAVKYRTWRIAILAVFIYVGEIGNLDLRPDHFYEWMNEWMNEWNVDNYNKNGQVEGLSFQFPQHK
jgi:hypothetical protein